MYDFLRNIGNIGIEKEAVAHGLESGVRSRGREIFERLGGRSLLLLFLKGVERRLKRKRLPTD